MSGPRGQIIAAQNYEKGRLNPDTNPHAKKDKQIEIYTTKMNESNDEYEIKWYQDKIAKLKTELEETKYIPNLQSLTPAPPPTSKDGSNSPPRQGRTYKLPNGGKRRTKRKSRKTKKRNPRKTYKP